MRKRAQDFLLFQKAFTATAVQLDKQLLQEQFVFIASGKIRVSPEQKSLSNCPLEPMIALLYIAVFIGACGLRFASDKSIVVEQRLIALGEFIRVKRFLHCRC